MEKLHFIQSPIYSRLIDAIREEGLQVAIEETININPKGGTLLGGGIHKLRVASTVRPEGKSGGYRVWYFYDEPDDIYLFFIIDKRKAPDLTPGQEKILVQDLHRALGKGKKGGKR
jgi:hypothetical protein